MTRFLAPLKLLWCLTASLSWPVLATSPLPAISSGEDCVVLLHGLGRTRLSMERLDRSLTRAGYRVVNLTYPSTRHSIEHLAEHQLAVALREPLLARAKRVHFVCHSMGGIVLRQYLSNHSLANLGRVVMLAPPNQGSEVVDVLKGNLLYRRWGGPSGQQIGTDDSDMPKRLGPVQFELGVIAGDRSLNPLFSRWLPGPDDGKVAVEATRVEALKDFKVVHATHARILRRKDAIQEVEQFLAQGRFSRK